MMWSCLTWWSSVKRQSTKEQMLVEWTDENYFWYFFELLICFHGQTSSHEVLLPKSSSWRWMHFFDGISSLTDDVFGFFSVSFKIVWFTRNVNKNKTNCNQWKWWREQFWCRNRGTPLWLNFSLFLNKSEYWDQNHHRVTVIKKRERVCCQNLIRISKGKSKFEKWDGRLFLLLIAELERDNFSITYVNLNAFRFEHSLSSESLPPKASENNPKMKIKRSVDVSTWRTMQFLLSTPVFWFSHQSWLQQIVPSIAKYTGFLATNVDLDLRKSTLWF